MINLYITTQNGTQTLTKLAPTITVSGDYQQCARMLDFDVLSSMTDVNTPKVDIPLGASALFMDDDQEIFMGNVMSREKGTENGTISFHCIDWGFYLNRNRGSYKFSGDTPEQITRRVCADFGVTVGAIAPAKTKIKRNFFGSTLYEIIRTAYNLDGEATGKKYHIAFEGRELCVREKVKDTSSPTLAPGVNIIGMNVSEGVEQMVNRVVIYDKDDKLIKKIGDENAQKLYGVMQEYIKQSGDESVLDKAQKLIDDNGYSQKITTDNLGDARLVTGGSIIVREPYTDTFGLFYIDRDVHTWKNGLYFNKLTLNFQAIVDDKLSGTEDKK